MGETAPRPYVSYRDYLALEGNTDRRHEWLDGQVYAMAGGTIAHSALSARMVAVLDALIGERSCVPHSSDLKIRTRACSSRCCRPPANAGVYRGITLTPPDEARD